MPPRWSRIAVLLAIVFSARSQTADWVGLSATATQLAKQGKYNEAIPIALQALHAIDADARLSSATPPNVSAALTQLGELMLELDASVKAESVFSKAFAIDSKLHGPQDASVASDLINGGRAYLRWGKNIEAERLFRRALDIDLKTFGAASAEAARDKGFLIEALTNQGRFGEAWPLLDGALGNMVKKLGPESPEVAQFIVQMGMLYERAGRAWDAWKAYDAAVKIDDKKLGPGHPDTVRIRGRYADALAEQGKYDLAEAEYRKAIDASAKSLGAEHPLRARLMSALGVLQLDEGGNPQSACLTLRDAVLIMGRTIGKEHPDYAAANRHLGACFRMNHDIPTALKLLNESMAIDTKVFGAEHPEVAEDYAFLGDAARDQGDFATAETEYAHALAIDEKVLGPMHYKTRALELKAARNYLAWKQPEKAEAAADRCVRGLFSDLQFLASSYMSEGDRLRFLKTVRDVIPTYLYLGYRYPDLPGIAGKMYNLALIERGAAASSAGAIRAQILASGDKDLMDRFDALTKKRQELAALQSSPEGDPAEFRARVNALEAEVNVLDEGLAFHSPQFASKAGLTQTAWADVQKALEPGASAVEYLRFDVTDGPVTKGFYAALTLTKDSGPKLIPLGETAALNKSLRSSDKSQSGVTRGVTAASPGVAGAGSGPELPQTKDMYLAFWKPIEASLSGAKRVYIAADGILNQFPIGLLADESGKYLFEKYDLRLINSTKELVVAPRVSTARTAVLMGNPSFDLSEAQQRAAVAKMSTNAAAAAAQESAATAASRGLPLMGGKLNVLPGTQTEIDSIAKELTAAKWQVQSFSGDQALEETLKAQRSPRLVHLATHGFFLPDQPFIRVTTQGVKQKIKIDDPMLRSGLYFAGAQRVEGGGAQVNGLEDGILTSLEATQLDLQGTELVVLSACETGLGDQENGEGVFGLRRALQEAGAQAVMMSMWSVPDKETQELMTLFYKKWLGGADKHEALRQAQLEEREVVRKRYAKDLPFYWGAFVLVGR